MESTLVGLYVWRQHCLPSTFTDFPGQTNLLNGDVDVGGESRLVIVFGILIILDVTVVPFSSWLSTARVALRGRILLVEGSLVLNSVQIGNREDNTYGLIAELADELDPLLTGLVVDLTSGVLG